MPLWSVPADGSGPARQLTIGVKHDRHPRFSPDGRTLAFLSDRRNALEDPPEGAKPGERDDAVQVYLLSARRWRGASADRPAARCRRLRLGARRRAARGDDLVPRRGPRGGCPGARSFQAQAGDAASVGLPLPGPARLPLQRCRLRRRPRDAPLDRRCRNRRGDSPDSGARIGEHASVVARRHPHRLRGRPPRRSRHHLPVQRVRRRRRVGSGDRRDRRPGPVRSAGLAGRLHDRGARPPLPGPGRQPQRRLALRGGRQRGTGERRHQPHGPPRPDDRLDDEQRRGARRGAAPRRGCRRRIGARHRAGGGLRGAVAHLHRRRVPRAPDAGPPTRVLVRRRAGPARGHPHRPAPLHGDRTCRRPSPRRGRRPRPPASRSGPAHRAQRRGALGADARRARGALVRGRGTADPGLVPTRRSRRRARRASGVAGGPPPRRSSPRSTAGRTPTTAGPCSGSGRCWSAAASACSPATRADRTATARRSTQPTIATGATARCATSWPASRGSWPRVAPIPSAWASPAARTAAT